MSRKGHESGWEALLADPELAGTVEAELFGLFAKEGRLRRAARELAEEEHTAGAWVDESEPAQQRARLAAQDRKRAAAARVYSDGRYRVQLRQQESGRELTQLDGPPGATVILEGAHHPLHPGRPLDLGAGALPPKMVLLDLRGRRRELVPE